jgi:hypothetical protein
MTHRESRGDIAGRMGAYRGCIPEVQSSVLVVRQVLFQGLRFCASRKTPRRA